MPKYHVKGVASWPKDHASAGSVEWEGDYEAASEAEAAKLGVEATIAAWKDAINVASTGVALVGS